MNMSSMPIKNYNGNQNLESEIWNLKSGIWNQLSDPWGFWILNNLRLVTSHSLLVTTIGGKHVERISRAITL